MTHRHALMALWVIVLAGRAVQAQPAATYGPNIYKEHGGDKMILKSGGELEFQTGSTLDLQSGTTFDLKAGVTTTVGATTTFDSTGVLELDNSRQIGRISWLSSDADSSVSVTGLSMPDAEYAVFLVPTTGVTPNGLTIDGADGFTVTLEAIVSSDVSQTFLVIPGNW